MKNFATIQKEWFFMEMFIFPVWQMSDKNERKKIVTNLAKAQVKKLKRNLK